ncbi:uncharacterized protein LOC134332389 isoform X2 [Trichomycterus rosablanca]|uniref:uncharacterized protein LOC134332389 isoform X2 n=1 Tax=Trichomycterus rosablanca TaxID=2290929 RepID=UPI002F35FE87
MGECLHTSADGLSKLVKWAHSHGTICTLIPSLKHMLTEGAHGQLTALWGCGAGHAYHWPVTASCKTGLKDRMCFERSSRGISSETLMQGAAAMQSSLAQRFLGSTGKSSKGDTNQTRDSYDFSNCSEPSEMDDNTEEDNNHLFDIVCESSATDEEIDLEPRIMHRKRGTKGQNSEDSGDPGAKKIKQERAEDYYTVANAQNQAGIDSAQLSQSINSHIRSSASLSASNNPPLLEDGDLARTSSSPVDTSSHSKSVHTSIGRSENKTHMDSNPGASQHMAGLGQAGKSDLVEVLPNGDFGMNFEDPSGAVHPEIDILAEQQNSAEPGSDGTAGPVMYEIERLKGLLQTERNRSALLGETITSLKQDKELLQQELTKKAELICEFLQDQLRPEKRRAHSSSQMEAGSSHQQLISSFPDEGGPFESPALFDSFEDVELHPLERQRPIKISSKRNRDGENTRVRMKNVVGVIARYMTALQEFRRSVSMKVAFDRVGVDRNTISRTAAIAELSLAAPEVFHALPPWDEKEETLAHYAVRCRQAMDDNIKAKIKAMKAKGELLPIVSK